MRRFRIGTGWGIFLIGYGAGLALGNPTSSWLGLDLDTGTPVRLSLPAAAPARLPGSCFSQTAWWQVEFTADQTFHSVLILKVRDDEKHQRSLDVQEPETGSLWTLVFPATQRPPVCPAKSP